ncbi:MAG: hypothetical protein R3F49_09025 [Planctomycetota bacterium]
MTSLLSRRAARALTLSLAAMLCSGAGAATAAPAAGPLALRPAPAQVPDLPSQVPDLKEEIDFSVRWLRGTQDLATGAYGGGVDGTSWALYALAVCPRKYHAGDGPFVAKALDYVLGLQDEAGSIAAPGADAAQRLAQTSRAAAALSMHVNERTGPALGKAVAWLTAQGVEEPDLGLPRDLTSDRTKALAATLELLRNRAADGSWDGEDGKVISTCRNIALLSRYKKVVEPKTAKPTSARALPKFDAAQRAEVDASILAGARFLLKQSVGGDHARWGAPGNPDAGITAMVAGALQAVPTPRPADIQGAVDDALVWLATLQREDGSIHQGRLANYVTSASILALARVPGNEERLARARAFLVRLQSDEGEGYSPDHPYYGGVGYGGDERPDLSNLQMALEALHVAGLAADDPAWQRSLVFLQRCQNRSESNDLVLQRDGVTIRPGDDGGSAYAPGESKAGVVKLADGTELPRSYGSMSYALLKGYVFAGLKKDDPRVQALWKWLQENYTLDLNPGFVAGDDPTAPYQGLFYYFHTMAKALDLFKEEVLVDGAGASHAWRAELSGRLIAMQSKADGSWVNENAPAWWEGNPVLATAYALLTLESARPGE